MTLLNTIRFEVALTLIRLHVIKIWFHSNLGGRWVKTFFLWFVDIITWKSCVLDETNLGNATISLTDNNCANKVEKSECITNGGTCKILIDGYYIEVALNVIYGLVWYQWGKRVLNYLQNVQRHEWHVLSKPSSHEEDIPLSEIVPSPQNWIHCSLISFCKWPVFLLW